MKTHGRTVFHTNLNIYEMDNGRQGHGPYYVEANREKPVIMTQYPPPHTLPSNTNMAYLEDSSDESDTKVLNNRGERFLYEHVKH